MTSRKERFWHPEAYARDEWIRKHAAELPRGSWVLDAGAGASKYRPLFAHCRYETQDSCQYQGELVRYLAPIDYVCDIRSVPLPTGALDAIVCTEVIEHVPDPVAVLREFSRLLKPGALLLLTAPLLSHLHMEPYHFYGGFTHYWYEHWLPQTGFEIETITAVGGPGRSATVFFQAFYTSWSAAERRLKGWRRAVSLALRGPAKVLAHYILPEALPKADRWLGNRVICAGYLVAARRSVREREAAKSEEAR